MMRKLIILFATVSACLLPMGSAQQAPSEGSPLTAIFQEIQTRAKTEAKADPAGFRLKAAAIADQHREEILSSSVSSDPGTRRLAAMLLGMASLSDSGADALVKLAKDPDKEVRYAALVSIPSGTNGKHQEANGIVLEALSETGNPAITRDAAFAASTLKLPEALPVFEGFLKSGDPLKTRYAIDAAGRYGAAGTSLLPELRRLLEKEAEASPMRDLLYRAVAAITGGKDSESKRAEKTGSGAGRPAESSPPGPAMVSGDDKRADPSNGPGSIKWLIAALVIFGLGLVLAWSRKVRRKT